MKDNIYKPTYDIPAVDYQREIRTTGEEIEKVVFYQKDEHIIENAPQFKEEIDQILEILKKTRIRKLTISIFNNKRLT